MKEFRLIVNESIRIALRGDFRSRARLSAVAYGGISREHHIYKKYISPAFEVALGVLKAYRKRIRRGKKSSVPYVRRLFLKAGNDAYWFDRETGRLRIPVRGTEGVQLMVPLSEWHRRFLSDASWSLGSLIVKPDRIVLALRRAAPDRFQPASAIALDTNEESLDGITVSGNAARVITISLGGVRQVQATHFARRRRLARKKSHDRRVLRALLRCDGARESRRVRQRLHKVSKSLVDSACAHRSAIVLETLMFHGPGGRSHRMNRRLSSWPRGELHRQIEYKAALVGVPIIKVNPAWTSKTCPVCGARRRDRVGQDFVCSVCDWEMDRQHNAACNILLSALASNEALARGVRFHPGALRDDVKRPQQLGDSSSCGWTLKPSGVELPSGDGNTTYTYFTSTRFKRSVST